MRKYDVVYSITALEDLKQLYSFLFYEGHFPDSAKKKINHLREEIRSLETTYSEHIRIKGFFGDFYHLRKMVVGNIMVYYVEDHEQRRAGVARIIYCSEENAEELNSEDL